MPRIIFEAAAVAAVVPICAACSGRLTQQSPDDGGADAVLLGVALQMSDAGLPFSVAALLGDGGDTQFSVGASCFGTPGCEPFSVADAGFRVADAGFGDADAGFGDADAGFRDVLLGVAIEAFDADKG